MSKIVGNTVGTPLDPQMFVKANPEEEATETLTKVKIGDKVYSLPSAVSLDNAEEASF